MTQASPDSTAGQAALPVRPEELQSLKHQNQLLLANLNATRKALADARQNEQRSMQMLEQTQALLTEREQTAAAALAACQAQLAESGAREQQLLALLQQAQAETEQEKALLRASSQSEQAESGRRDTEILAKIDRLEQALLEQQTRQEHDGPPAPDAARQREQALVAQVAALQQVLAEKDRALEATAAVTQQIGELLANGQQLMAAVTPLQQQLTDRGRVAETAIQTLQSSMQAAMEQALMKMDQLLQTAAVQAQKLEQIREQTTPSASAPAARPSRFATDDTDHFVLDLPSDLLPQAEAAPASKGATSSVQQPVPASGNR